MKRGAIVEMLFGGPPMVVAEVELGILPVDDPQVMSALVYYFDNVGVLHEHRVHGHLLREIPGPINGPQEFGIPEALQKAKDEEAQRLADERDRQWAEDQVRYAHTTGFIIAGPEAGVTRTKDGW